MRNIIRWQKILGWTRIISTSGCGRARISTPTISNLSIRVMETSGADTGVSLLHMADSVISRNSFEGGVWGSGMSVITNVTVTQNHFHLPPTTYWAAGIYMSWGAFGVLIADNTFYGYGSPHKMGIHLHNNSHLANATPEFLSHDNRIERNVLYGLDDPIYDGGSGIASRNVVRDNQIFGNYPESITRSYPVGFPTQFTAIRVKNNVDIEIVGNYIFSGWSLPYYKGIELLEATTIKPDANGNPLLIYNSTCGVFDPLVPPPGVAESSVDAGNYWNVFCTPPEIC
jgi:hypothetical protein